MVCNCLLHKLIADMGESTAKEIGENMRVIKDQVLALSDPEKHQTLLDALMACFGGEADHTQQALMADHFLSLLSTVEHPDEQMLKQLTINMISSKTGIPRDQIHVAEQKITQIDEQSRPIKPN